ncbi:MAG: signal peptidase I [Patescibacteria group bacterium]|nr:signal peptidase I [Patescibacteria group bacterium]
MEGASRGNFFTELLKFIVLAIIIVVPIRLWVAQPFIVSGASMEPTFETGQYLIIDELTYHFSNPQRGDIIIFRYPLNPSEFFIKRVIGLPGETVHVTPQNVTITEVNGATETLSEPYLVNQGNEVDLTVRLGSDQYFVMGDNRPDSSDSRSWGPVPRSDIVGRAFLRLLPVPVAGFFPGKFSFPPPTLPSSASTTLPASINLL